MNLVEKQVIELLNGAMHGYSVDLKDKVDWNKIIEEGRAHKVEGLLYLAVNKESSKKIDKDLLEVSPYKNKDIFRFLILEKSLFINKKYYICRPNFK